MFSRKAIRRILLAAGLLAAGAALLYAFRWPLLEGRVRRELARAAAEILRADVDVDRLGGTLLTSVVAEGVTLTPRPGSPLRPGSVRRLEVHYGFLGLSDPKVRVEGGALALAPNPRPTPPHEAVRDAARVFRSFSFPGRLSVRDTTLGLADGRVLRLDDARLEGRAARAAGSAGGFGRVEVEGHNDGAGGLSLSATASEGPVRRVRLDLEPGGALRVEGVYEAHPVGWVGEASFDAEGGLAAATGNLTVKEGRARTDLDFLTGRAGVDIDATVELARDVRAEVALRLRAEGPAAGPLEEWTLHEGTARAARATYRSLDLEDVAASFGRGTLQGIPWTARARSGGDRAEARGTLRWEGGLELEASLRASAAALDRYLGLVESPPSVRAAGLVADGRFTYGKEGVSFDGTVDAGPGAFQGWGWDSVRVGGRFDPGGAAVRELVVLGTPFAPAVKGAGSLEGRRFEARLEAGEDRVAAKGEWKEGGDLKAEFRVEGPLAWLRAFQAALPESWRPVRAEGRLTRAGERADLSIDFATRDGLSGAPRLSGRRKGDGWEFEAEAGAFTAARRPRLQHGAVKLELKPGAAALSEVRVELHDPPIAGAVSGSVAWDERTSRVDFQLRDAVAWGVELDALRGRFAVDRASGDVEADVRWGAESEDHFLVLGKLGRENDFRLSLRLSELDTPLLRRAVPAGNVRGGIEMGVRITGTRERPGLEGHLALSDLSLFGAPPFSLEVPLRSEGGRLRVHARSTATAYGRVTVEGEVPLADLSLQTPVDLTLRVEAEDFRPFLERVPPKVRPWIPRGKLVATASLRGPLESVAATAEAEFRAAEFRPPRPVGRFTDLRLSARWDGRKLWLDAVEGRLGHGPFRGKGWWDPRAEGRPLALSVTGEEALVVDEELARLRINPEVTFRYDDTGGFRVEGDVVVPLAIWHREFAPPRTSAEPRTRDVEPPRLRLVPHPGGGFRIGGLGGLEGLALDLRFKTGGEFRLENSVAGLLLEAEGRLGGTAAEPALSGTLRARRGEIKLATGVFVQVDSAEAYLPPEAGKEPRVRFEGRVGKGEGAITIVLAGALHRPSLTLRSDPPRSEEDLKAILAFGATPGSLSGQAALGTLAGRVLAQTADGWPSADRRESLFGRFNFTVLTEEAPGVRRPWELPVAGTARGTVLRTEYVYNAYFSIIGESDREGNVSGDVKLRIRF